MVIFFSSVKSVYFNQFFCLLCIQKLVLCGSGFSLFAVLAYQALPIWGQLTNNTLRKQRWDAFLYPEIRMP